MNKEIVNDNKDKLLNKKRILVILRKINFDFLRFNSSYSVIEEFLRNIYIRKFLR